MTKQVTQQHNATFIRGLHNLQPFSRRTVVTIGSFDGVHIGHQTMLQQLSRLATEQDLLSVAVTFEPQPREYFSREQAPARLMRLREKIDALLEQRVDKIVCLQFNRSLRSLSAQEFIKIILVNKLATHHLIIGDDFRFGCDRNGNYDMLVEAGKQYGFDVQKISSIRVEKQRISSTLIRHHVEQGQFQQAKKLLGRPFSVSGRVVYGQQLGNTLGFPTANIHLHRYRVPLSGVFAVLVKTGDKVYQGAANVGVRPTVDNLVKPILEVHLLDFSGNLYGKRITVEFMHKIRDEKKFSTLDELVENIRGDTEKARVWFNSQ